MLRIGGGPDRGTGPPLFRGRPANTFRIRPDTFRSPIGRPLAAILIHRERPARAICIFGHASVALATPAAFRARFVGYFWRSRGQRVRGVAKEAGRDQPAEAGGAAVTSVTKPRTPAGGSRPVSETTIRYSRHLALPGQRARPVQAGRVHNDELRVRSMHDAADDASGGRWPARRDRHLRADERVGERRLSRVGTADEAGEPRPVRAHGPDSRSSRHRRSAAKRSW